MRVAGFMSGSGSNIRRLLEVSKANPEAYEFVMLFSDRCTSKAPAIGKEFDVPVFTRDIEGFYAARNAPLRDMNVRRHFDWETQRLLEPHMVDVIAYGGYMSIVSPLLLRTYLGINVHPADLRVMDGERRKYTGDRAVAKALAAGEKQLRATTHILEQRVDYGRILMVSKPMDVNDGETPDDAQNRLKTVGDLVIFPQTLLDLAQGRYSQDENGALFFDGQQIPNGVEMN